MIGTPPSRRQIPESPLIHAKQFANEYVDRLEHDVEGRMHNFNLLDDQIGFADRTRGIPWAVFHPNSSTGGNILGRRVVVNSGIFNPELLTERYGPEVGKIWAKSRLRDRIDAVIAHEVAESITGTHEGAEALAAETELPVSDGARRILRAMAGRGR